MSRKVKSISFDLDDEYEIELLHHAEMINQKNGKARHFSRYIKQLIMDDLNRMNTNIATPIISAQNQLESVSNEDKEAMSSFF